MRDRNGKVIYVGKAKSLRSRVRNYFQQGTLRTADPKIRGLIKSIEDFDFLVVRNEAEAVLTEGRMIKEYRPRYNTTFKDDKRFLLLSIDFNEIFPRIKVCRIRKNDHKEYFGPYASAASARTAKDFVEKRFGLRQCLARHPGESDHKHCLADIIRFCGAPCIGKIDTESYRNGARQAAQFLRGESPEILSELAEQMEKASDKMQFERAATIRDTLLLLRKAVKQRANGLKTFTVKKEEAALGLQDIQNTLKLPAPPRTIETFDISNISGTFAVASMVCSVNGIPDRKRYRHFRIKTIEGPDDPGMMGEAIRRRYKRLRDEQQPMPDLVMVDGGITQLRAARRELDALGLESLKAIGIAKRYEEIHWDVHNIAPPIRFPRNSPALKILQNIRDEAHRFALTYHRRIRERRIRDSALDEIPGIGERRKEILLKQFGSVDRLRKADVKTIAEVNGIGPKFAQLIVECLSP